MEHQLGRIDIISWQGRRARDSRRVVSLTAILSLLAVVSALLLAARFVGGAALPLELLQVAFAVLAASGALLLTRALVALILRFQRP